MEVKDVLAVKGSEYQSASIDTAETFSLSTRYASFYPPTASPERWRHGLRAFCKLSGADLIDLPKGDRRELSD